jgi:hypothetical protein
MAPLEVTLLCWPLLRAMQDAQDLDLVVYFIDGNKWQGSKNEFPRPLDAAKASAIWKGTERPDTFDHRFGYSLR